MVHLQVRRSIDLLIDKYLKNVQDQVKETLLVFTIEFAAHSDRLKKFLSDDGHSLRMLEELHPIFLEFNGDVHKLD